MSCVKRTWYVRGGDKLAALFGVVLAASLLCASCSDDGGGGGSNSDGDEEQHIDGDTTWTVSFDLAFSNEGVGYIRKTVGNGEKVTPVSGTYHMQGYENFDGSSGVWLNNRVPFDFDTPITSNITLAPQWVRATPASVKGADGAASSIDDVVLSAGGNYKFTGTITPDNIEILVPKIPSSGDPIVLDMGECVCSGELPGGYKDTETMQIYTTFPTLNRLSKVVLPQRITNIPDYFMWSGGGCVKEVVIPDSVTSIGELAFFECGGMDMAQLPSALTEVGDAAFHSCYGIKEMTIPSTVSSMGNGVFCNWRSTQSIILQWSTSAKPAGWDAKWYSGSHATVKMADGTTVTINADTGEIQQ